MTDKFGRQKSTRWVRASVPSYGDEWNDDDGYDYGSISEESGDEALRSQRSPQLNDIPTERFILPDSNKEPPINESPQKPNEKLVLSIDNLKEHDSDNDSNSEEDPTPKDHSDNTDIKDNKNTTDGTVKTQTLTVDSNLPDTIEPPTPNYNIETPSSERSFQSDTDSIQNETDLRVANPAQVLTHSRTQSQPQSHKNNSLFGYSDIIEEYPDDPAPEQDGHESDTDKEPKNENLVLSIDNKTYGDDSDDSDQDDPIPYYEKQSHGHKDNLGYSTSDDDEDDNETSGEHNHSHNRSDALDSLINDLQSASFRNDDHEGLPKMDSIHDMSLPDFENNYDYYDDDTDDKPVTPIAPLSTKEEKSYHEKYISELSGHKPSIRKPPAPLKFSGKDSNPDLSVPASRGSSIKKVPKESVVSPSYSNFGDAVDAYMSDKEDRAEPLRESEEENDNDKEMPPQDSDMNEEATPYQRGEIYYLSDEEDVNSNDVSETTPKPDSEALNPPIGSLDVNASDLHPVGSTGSLSTGKYSFDQKNEFPEPPATLDRRDSTMSTNTFSMGGWKPNTNNFRDQFINDNDNESNFNFSLDNESSSGYQKFTKPRNVSDNMSLMSSVSMPETVDVPLPSINEDGDDHDLDKDDTFSSGDQSRGEPSRGLGITSSNMTSDSILNEHDYEHGGKFHEEMSSKESLSKDSARQQRYTSLLPPISDDNKSSVTGGDSTLNESSSIVPSISISNTTGNDDQLTHKRIGSDASTFTQSTRKTFPPNAYPVSNWKTIMKPSQSIDRITLLKEALEKEIAYDTGLQTWLSETLTKSNNSSNIHIGRIASEAYQNATHNDLRRHASIRSRVSSVKDKVETSGLHASNLGKKFFSRGKKLMRSSS